MTTTAPTHGPTDTTPSPVPGLAPETLGAIRDRDALATPGPWHWSGNTDNHQISLSTWAAGLGRSTVFSTMLVERTEADLDRDDFADVYDDLDDGHWADIVDSYTADPYTGGIRHDARLAFTSDQFLVNAEDIAIYEVAPDATSRQDPSVYRADIIGLRNPDADFIAHARADVTALLAEVDRLTAENAALRASAGAPSRRAA